jgi:iron complex transport system ATP-binding protein
VATDASSRHASALAVPPAPAPATRRVDVSAQPPAGGRLRARDLTLAYDGAPIVKDLSVVVPDGAVTVIIGPNACGKSTLLRALARLLRPRAGAALLDGAAVHTLPTREVAAQLGLLPQAPSAPEGLTVHDLVSRGRYPHQRWFSQWSEEDEAAGARRTNHAARRADDVPGPQLPSRDP